MYKNKLFQSSGTKNKLLKVQKRKTNLMRSLRKKTIRFYLEYMDQDPLEFLGNSTT